MKKMPFFILLILVFFVFQNVYSEEPRSRIYVDSSSRRYVLWRVHSKELYDSDKRMKVKIDSILKEDFHTHLEWKIYIPNSTKYVGELNLNTYYLVLATAGCTSEVNRRCTIMFSEGDYALPDTPENRSFLNQKWSETTIIYKSREIGGIGDVD